MMYGGLPLRGETLSALDTDSSNGKQAPVLLKTLYAAPQGPCTRSIHSSVPKLPALGALLEQ